MSVTDYGQQIQDTGLAGLQGLGDAESRRIVKKNEMDMLNSESKGQAIGTLVGTGLGIAKGAYTRANPHSPIKGISDEEWGKLHDIYAHHAPFGIY
jgi:hypothetical protein